MIETFKLGYYVWMGSLIIITFLYEIFVPQCNMFLHNGLRHVW
jgi:hypothetical protein